jgi:hypothetical protein
VSDLPPIQALSVNARRVFENVLREDLLMTIEMELEIERREAFGTFVNGDLKLMPLLQAADIGGGNLGQLYIEQADDEAEMSRMVRALKERNKRLISFQSNFDINIPEHCFYQLLHLGKVEKAVTGIIQNKAKAIDSMNTLVTVRAHVQYYQAKVKEWIAALAKGARSGSSNQGLRSAFPSHDKDKLMREVGKEFTGGGYLGDKRDIKRGEDQSISDLFAEDNLDNQDFNTSSRIDSHKRNSNHEINRDQHSEENPLEGLNSLEEANNIFEVDITREIGAQELPERWAQMCFDEVAPVSAMIEKSITKGAKMYICVNKEDDGFESVIGFYLQTLLDSLNAVQTQNEELYSHIQDEVFPSFQRSGADVIVEYHGDKTIQIRIFNGV